MRSTTAKDIRVVVRPLSFAVDMDIAVADYAAAQDAAILESCSPDPSFARYTILAQDAADRVLIAEAPIRFERCLDLLEQTVFKPQRFFVDGPALPYLGGWIGCLTYDAALSIAVRTRPRPTNVPAADFRLFDTLAVFDHEEHQWYAVAVDWPASAYANRPPVEQRLADLFRRFARMESDGIRVGDFAMDDRPTVGGDIDTHGNDGPDWFDPGDAGDLAPEDYYRAVERVHRYIAAGDVYQVNLARRFSRLTRHAPEALYRRLRASNPSSHAAFIRVDDHAILSSSPELFLAYRHGKVITRPIKGTRPRGGCAADDARLRDELAYSAKDHAELTMIIDLMRNDLGRVCEFGSVRVTDPGRLETLPTVFHRTATVEGHLRRECDACDLLRATFPGGSITGAPKIRAMQIIEELEPAPRGVYCGSVGYVGLDGAMTLNIAIRTLTQTGTTVRFHAGSGLVADSDPKEEYMEILAKAQGLFAAVEGADNRAETRPMEAAIA